jgi:hypothetical protein
MTKLLRRRVLSEMGAPSGVGGRIRTPFELPGGSIEGAARVYLVKNRSRA